MFGHIGLTINVQSDIESFYKDLLGMKEVREFDIDEDLSERIFRIKNKAPITVLSNDDIVLELFLTDQKQKPVYNHIGISVHNRDNMMEKAKSMGFSVTYIERESKDALLFISDNSGNLFEIKEANN